MKKSHSARMKSFLIFRRKRKRQAIDDAEAASGIVYKAIARLPCRSHFAVHAVQSGLLGSRGNRCLVLLLSERFSLNKTAVNRRHGFVLSSNSCCTAGIS